MSPRLWGSRRVGCTLNKFFREDRGSVTVWSLTWLLGIGIMVGLAMDSGNAWRHKTLLVSTADVASLAASMDINPSKGPYVSGAYGAAESSALWFAGRNLSWGFHGNYMQADDVHVGHWDQATRTFVSGEDFGTPDESTVNAVRVFLGQNTENDNNLPTTLLRLIGFQEWEINATATAVRGYNECYINGLMAEHKVCVRSNNTFYPGFCVHGEQGLTFQNNNTWHDGVHVSTPEGASTNIAADNYSPGGLDLQRQTLDIPMVDQIPEIAQGILQRNDEFGHMAMPAPWEQAPGGVILITNPSIGSNNGSSNTWLNDPRNIQFAQLEGTGETLIDLTDPLLEDTKVKPHSQGCVEGGSTGSYVEPYNGNLILGTDIDVAYGPTGSYLEHNRVYYYPSPAGKLTIDGDLANVVIVSEARIEIAAGSTLENVTLVSMHDDDSKHSVKLVNNVRMGRDDGCTPGGGVRVFAMGSIAGSSMASWHGAMLVSGGNIHFGAQSEGVRGIAAFAKGNTSFTSNNTFGTPAPGTLDASGSCSGGVDLALPDDAYTSVLVD